MEVPRFDAATEASTVANALTDAGCAIVERLADPAVVDAILADTAPQLAATPFGVDDFAGRRTRRCGALVARSPSFAELALEPLALDVVKTVLEPHCHRVQIHLTQIIAIGSGESGQTIHRDQLLWHPFEFPPGVEPMCNLMWAATDFTEQNGATRVIPGSHRWGYGLEPAYAETIPAEMPKGSVLFYTGSVYHGGGANRSSEDRIGINVGHSFGWLRQEENQYLVCPPEVAADLPVPLSKLIGYDMGGYALGYVDDVRHPQELLDRYRDTPAAGRTRTIAG